MNSIELENFGRTVIAARDLTITLCNQSVAWKVKSSDSLMSDPMIEHLRKNPEFVTRFASMIADDLLHNVLQNIQQEWISLVINWKDIVSESDGLAGELFSDRGWLYKYGKYPSTFNE